MSPLLFFKSLADDTRLRCLLLINSEGELCVCELMVALEDSQPKISRHLAQLKSAGLLLDRRQGQWVFYRLNPEMPNWCHALLDETLAANQHFVQDNLHLLNQMGSRPERDNVCC